MNLKNHNPYTGLRQIVTGHQRINRYFFIQLVRSKKLSLTDIGALVVFLMSTDWDKDEHRHGRIRYSLQQLKAIWKLSRGTFSKRLGKLVKCGLLDKTEDILRVVNFDEFIGKNEKLTNGEIEVLFPELFKGVSKSKQIEAGNINTFRIPYKSNLGVNRGENYPATGDSRLVEDDGETELKRWFDSQILSNDRRLERDVCDVFFNGDWELLERNTLP